MRILQVSSAQEIGGGEKHLVELVQNLAGRGHEIHLVARPQSPLVELLNGDGAIKFHEVPLRNALDFNSSQALASLARELHVDVVHAHVARDYPICGRATRAASVPFVLTRHHFNPLKGGLLAQWSLRNVAYMIAVSKEVARTLTLSLPRLASRVRVIPNWIGSLSLSPLDRQTARERLQISRPFCVAIVGKISPIKGQALFVEMARLVAARRAQDDVEFLIAGLPEDSDRDYEQEIKNSIARSGLSDRIRFAGFVDNIAELMSAFDIVVAPSENEAFSLVVAEAMAARSAVVGSPRGGIRELIEGGPGGKEAGVLVPEIAPQTFATQVAALLDDSDRRRRIGEFARASILARFDQNKVISQIEALYQTLPINKK